MSAIPVIKTRNIKAVKCMFALNPQERSPHKILLQLANIMREKPVD